MSEEAKKPPACPACGSEDVKAIVYGLPSDDTMEAAGRDEMDLGGCVVAPENPDWRCRACEFAWPDPSLPPPWER